MGAGMYAKTLELSFLATLALFCALAALIMDHAVFGSVFLVLCAAATLGAAERYWR